MQHFWTLSFFESSAPESLSPWALGFIRAREGCSTLLHTCPKVRFRTVFAPGGAPGVAGKSDSDPGRATLPGPAREV